MVITPQSVVTAAAVVAAVVALFGMDDCIGCAVIDCVFAGCVVFNGDGVKIILSRRGEFVPRGT